MMRSESSEVILNVRYLNIFVVAVRCHHFENQRSSICGRPPPRNLFHNCPHTAIHLLDWKKRIFRTNANYAGINSSAKRTKRMAEGSVAIKFKEASLNYNVRDVRGSRSLTCETLTAYTELNSTFHFIWHSRSPYVGRFTSASAHWMATTRLNGLKTVQSLGTFFNDEILLL